MWVACIVRAGFVFPLLLALPVGTIAAPQGQSVVHQLRIESSAGYFDEAVGKPVDLDAFGVWIWPSGGASSTGFGLTSRWPKHIIPVYLEHHTGRVTLFWLIMEVEMIIGAHLSIAKGMPAAVEQLKAIAGNAFQFFTRNPRGGRARDILAREVQEFKQLREAAGVKCVVGHMPYTINLATNRPDIYTFGKTTLLADLQRFDQTGVDYLVLHPGSHLGDGSEMGIRRIVEALTYVLEGYQGGNIALLLETMSGQGTEIGGDLAELEEVFARLGWPEQIGVCLDTCHLLAAGHDLTSIEGLDQLVERLDDGLGLERVKLVHLNDSKKERGSHADRHANIGQGTLGIEGIVKIINHPALRNLPFVLETPVNNYLEYGTEIELVRQLRTR